MYGSSLRIYCQIYLNLFSMNAVPIGYDISTLDLSYNDVKRGKIVIMRCFYDIYWLLYLRVVQYCRIDSGRTICKIRLI